MAFFCNSTTIQLGDGANVKFWTDPWIDGCSISELAPRLIAAANCRNKSSRTVAAALQHKDWLADIQGALTIQVTTEYIQIRTRVDAIALQNTPDNFIWRWHSSGAYTTKSAYRALFYTEVAVADTRELWRTRAPNKCIFFIWLALHERCWTSDRLQRHGLRDDNFCALCDQEPETLHHLLLFCAYSREVWHKCFRRYGFAYFQPSREETLADWWLRMRKSMPKPGRKQYDSLLILVAWSIWLERNARVFRNNDRWPVNLVEHISSELQQWGSACLVITPAPMLALT